MKKIFLLFFILSAFSAAFAQKISVVGIMPFQAAGRVTAEEAASVTNQVISELKTWGTLTVVQQEAGTDFIVRGTLSRQGNDYVLTAETTETDSKKKLNDSREQAASLSGFSFFSFCAKITEKIPFPNYLAGKWQSTINMADGPIVCIIEFKADRTVMVERYDTWEHRDNNLLRYEGYGTGTYSYAGYFTRKNVTVASRQVQVDAMANINLELEETLPDQTKVNQSALGLQFNGDRSSFEFVSGMLPCGRNYDGSPAFLGFTRFTKM